MDEQWKETLMGFETVWQRVQGTEEAAEPALCKTQGAVQEGKQSDTTMLEALINAEADGAARYRAASRLTEGRGAETLRGLAADCRRNMKRLQTEYFLLVGDTWIPQTEKLPTDGLLGYLRRAYLGENAASRMYMEAAIGAESAMLRQLYGELEANCVRRRETLHSLVQRVLG